MCLGFAAAPASRKKAAVISQQLRLDDKRALQFGLKEFRIGGSIVDRESGQV
jgi:hypothetical protein